MEKFDIYDINRVKTGETIERGTKCQEGQFRMVVHICILNSKNEMLIQQRLESKDTWPNKWDISVGGCSIAGEDSRASITRELKEELGLDYDFSNIRPKFTINFDTGFDDWYVIRMDVDLDSIKLQKEEVKAARFATKEEIYRLIDEGEFIHYHKSVIEMCYAMAGQKYGAFRDVDGRKV